MSRAVLAEALASAFLSGAWTTCALAKRGRLLLGQQTRWPIRLARRVLARFPTPPRDAFTELAALIERDRSLATAWRSRTLRLQHLRFGEVAVAMAPRAGWELPHIDTSGDLARWLLFNCVRHGPASQNRDVNPDFRAHLAGKLAWIRSVRADKAAPLDSLFARIDWSAQGSR